MNIVSLGGQCSVVYQLIKQNKRIDAYPFDWCKINIKKLINVLNNNFKDYENIILKKISENHKLIELNCITKKNSMVFKNNYGIEFAHEISKKYEINNFKESLLRRINRFKKLKNPLFIRLEYENLSEKKILLYKNLENILEKYFENFKIILISKIKYQSKYTNWYELNAYSDDWKYDNLNWDKIFNI